MVDYDRVWRFGLGERVLLAIFILIIGAMTTVVMWGVMENAGTAPADDTALRMLNLFWLAFATAVFLGPPTLRYAWVRFVRGGDA